MTTIEGRWFSQLLTADYALILQALPLDPITRRPCCWSQDPGLEVQSSQGLADEEVSHWGAALALLALQVGFLRSEHDACITK